MGFYAPIDSTSSDFDPWVLRDTGLIPDYLEPRPDCPAEPSRASKVFADEGASEVTISLVPDIVLEVEERYTTNEMPTERGYRVTHAAQASSRRRWVLRFLSRATADRDTLRTAFETLEGGRGALTFTEPITDASIKARALGGTIRYAKRNPGVYDVEFTVEELLT